MSQYFDPRMYKITILDMLKYDAVQDADGIIYKDHGDYVRMLVPMNNKKGHDTYDFYYDSNGKIIKIVGHRTNSGFVGTKTV